MAGFTFASRSYYDLRTETKSRPPDKIEDRAKKYG